MKLTTPNGENPAATQQANEQTGWLRPVNLQVPYAFRAWLKAQQQRSGPAWRRSENLDDTLMRMLAPAKLAEYFGWLWAETTREDEKTENGTKTSERNKTGNRKQQKAGFYGERGPSGPELGEELLD